MRNSIILIKRRNPISNKSIKKEIVKNKDGNIIEIREYNENGYPIYYKDTELKSEQWNMYNENGNKIAYKNSNGVEFSFEYEYYED